MSFFGKRKGVSPTSGGDGGVFSISDEYRMQQLRTIYNDPGTLSPGDASDVPLGHTATGGVISDWLDPSPGAVHRTHVFTSSGTFAISQLSSTYPANIEYVVVGGGAGGGGLGGGGGGGGGFRTNLNGHPLAGSAYPVSATDYTVVVGSGGHAGSVLGNTAPSVGGSGADSEFYPAPVSYPDALFIRGAGSGGGGAWSNSATPAVTTGYNGNAGGGSGGGGGAQDGSMGNNVAGGSAGAADPNHPAVAGYAGGAGGKSPGTNFTGGGGGGAGGVGTASGASNTGGPGGDGIPIAFDVSTAYYYGGGGGAGNAPYVNPGGTNDGGSGGQGGGGGGGGNGAGGTNGRQTGDDGGPAVGNPGGNGAFTTGGGGGGSSHSTGWGGNGGSGIVMVKYQIGSVAPVAKATGGDISLYGDKWIHTFTHSGTFDTKPTWNATDVEYVVVGGGGSGGLKLYFGAGGGAGAYRTGTTPIGAHPVSTSIQIGGGGGVNHGGHPTPSPAALDGTPSYFGSPITSPGGGGGGHHSDGASRPGGSGGGGSPDTPAPMVAGGTATGDPFPGTIGSTPANGWGHNGGAGDPVSNTYWGAGGGGGAGAVGTDGTSALGGPGGVGMQLPSTFHNPMSTVGAPGPASPPFTGATTSGKYWVAGGGGGSAHSSSDPTPKSGTGGAGGGGKGGNTNNGYNAAENTGSGGGGNERNAGPQQRAGRGGSGIVMIAYPL